MDHKSLGALYESLERVSASAKLEELTIKRIIAAYSAGAEGSAEVLENEIDRYKVILGYGTSEDRADGIQQLQKDFGRGI